MMLTVEAPQPVVAERRGRPRLAPETWEACVLLPEPFYAACCREARARDVSVSTVLREAIIAGRHVLALQPDLSGTK